MSKKKYGQCFQVMKANTEKLFLRSCASLEIKYMQFSLFITNAAINTLARSMKSAMIFLYVHKTKYQSLEILNFRPKKKTVVYTEICIITIIVFMLFMHE